MTEYHCLAHPPPAPDDCGMLNFSPYEDVPCKQVDYKGMTNETACNDGYAAGFVHWCASDIKGCEGQVKAHAIPDFSSYKCGRDITC